MEHLFWYLAGYGLLMGYLYSVLSCMFDSLTDEWWEPWILGAAAPFWWVYENRMGIAAGAAFLMALALFFVFIACLGMFCS
jgi:hypothetical protein